MAIQAHLFPDNLVFAFGNSQDLSVETVSGFDNLCFASPHQQFIHLDHFQNQKLAFSQSISDHIDRQRFEFEQFVHLQNERLRIAMQEERKQQMAILAKKYELKSEFLVKQKEEEMARAAKRNMELQNLVKKMEMENEAWQTAVGEKEAMIAWLKSSIQRLRETAAEDAESWCENGEEKEMKCRWCNSRNSCVVMLPCRHLSSCKDCELFLDSCPLCTLPKKASIHALI